MFPKKTLPPISHAFSSCPSSHSMIDDNDPVSPHLTETTNGAITKLHEDSTRRNEHGDTFYVPIDSVGISGGTMDKMDNHCHGIGISINDAFLSSPLFIAPALTFSNHVTTSNIEGRSLRL